LSNGTTREDTFAVPSNSAKFAAAFKAWCSLGVQASVTSSSGAANGDPVQWVRVKLTIVNPGTKPVTVTSAAFDKGQAHWNPASVTVPPRGTRTLLITATHTSCGTQDTPWNAGLLKSSGRTIKVNDDTQWC
jgi:P pilus assembly chaperone PapD